MALNDCDWSATRSAITIGNATLAYDRFIGKYTELYKKIFVPMNRKNSRRTPKKPWMSAALLKSCKTKDKLYIRYKKIPQKLIKQNILHIVISLKR